MYTYMYVCIHICVYTYMYVYIYVCINTCMSARSPYCRQLGANASENLLIWCRTASTAGWCVVGNEGMDPFSGPYVAVSKM